MTHAHAQDLSIQFVEPLGNQHVVWMTRARTTLAAVPPGRRR
ncbi:hypothetical protein [Roseateles sp.]|nr:hypothetical protein [Roseateles sp.]